MESLEDGTIELLAKVRQFSHLDENVHGTPFWYSSLSFPHLKLLNEHNTASTSHDMHMPCHFIVFSTCSVCTFYKPWPTIWQCEDFKLKLLFYHTHLQSCTSLFWWSQNYYSVLFISLSWTGTIVLFAYKNMIHLKVVHVHQASATVWMKYSQYISVS